MYKSILHTYTYARAHTHTYVRMHAQRERDTHNFIYNKMLFNSYIKKFFFLYLYINIHNNFMYIHTCLYIISYSLYINLCLLNIKFIHINDHI